MLIKINEVKTYTLKEFFEIQRNKEVVCAEIQYSYNQDDITMIDKMIGHVKRNKVAYKRLILITALFLHVNSFVFAAGLEEIGPKVIDIFLGVMKWACIGRGLYEMTMTMVSGGNIKQSITEGVQYWIGFLFLQFYPQLYEIFAGVTF
ncbi:Uncharacterised protein [uncultured Clostridium sp.]|nr:Uncharacterised protein [uncultured Clostridium sp.]